MPDDAPISAQLSYLTVLERLHSGLRPQTYLEIGSDVGKSLRLANCKSIAVDPRFRLTDDAIGPKPACLLFQMPSDRFFAENDPKSLLGSPIDIAFIDGMHLFEYCLRDFSNVERHAKANSVIAIHDIIPGDLEMAARIPVVGSAWTGDVWKVILLLLHYRPDLKIICLDSPPTGIALVTNLNPSSRLLTECYFDLVEEYRSKELEEIGLASYRSMIPLASTDEVSSTFKIAARFWL